MSTDGTITYQIHHKVFPDGSRIVCLAVQGTEQEICGPPTTMARLGAGMVEHAMDALEQLAMPRPDHEAPKVPAPIIYLPNAPRPVT